MLTLILTLLWLASLVIAWGWGNITGWSIGFDAGKHFRPVYMRRRGFDIPTPSVSELERAYRDAAYHKEDE